MAQGKTTINLLPREIIEQRQYELVYPWVVSVTAILLLLVGLSFGFNYFTVENWRTSLHTATEDTVRVQMQADELVQYEEVVARFNKRTELVNTLLADRIDPFRITSSVMYYFPREAWLSSLVIDEVTGVELVGYVEDVWGNPETQDWSGVSRIMQQLGQSPLFKDLWLTKGDIVESAELDGQLAGGIWDSFSITSDAKLTLGVTTADRWIRAIALERIELSKKASTQKAAPEEGDGEKTEEKK